MASVPGRGLQEIACGARQAELLPGSGPEAQEQPRSRDPEVPGASGGAVAPRRRRLRSLGLPGSPFSFSAAAGTCWRLEGLAQQAAPRVAPREPALTVLGAPGNFFFFWENKTQRESKSDCRRGVNRPKALRVPEGQGLGGGDREHRLIRPPPPTPPEDQRGCRSFA